MLFKLIIDKLISFRRIKKYIKCVFKFTIKCCQSSIYLNISKPSTLLKLNFGPGLANSFLVQMPKFCNQSLIILPC